MNCVPAVRLWLASSASSIFVPLIQSISPLVCCPHFYVTMLYETRYEDMVETSPPCMILGTVYGRRNERDE